LHVLDFIKNHVARFACVAIQRVPRRKPGIDRRSGRCSCVCQRSCSSIASAAMSKERSIAADPRRGIDSIASQLDSLAEPGEKASLPEYFADRGKCGLPRAVSRGDGLHIPLVPKRRDHATNLRFLREDEVEPAKDA